MIRVRKGNVIKILTDYPDRQELLVQLEGLEAKAIAYPTLSGKVRLNDEVWLNTTAVHLSLGTGGYHFVMGIIGREVQDLENRGHIMKMRYTPWQIKVLTVEEEESPYHSKIEAFKSLADTPVVVGTLHSMIAPVIMAYKTRFSDLVHDYQPRVVYIMTDGAALPIAFSRQVKELKERGLINLTITCGHAFGGDLETVNIYSALSAAKAIGEADLIVVAMGPGIVGTGTKYGFSGIEQAYILEAAERLGGNVIAVPRISFADPRFRHQGISHHTRTVLGLTYARVTVGIPMYLDKRAGILKRQILDDGLRSKHHFYYVSHPSMKDLFTDWGIEVKTMGRSYDEDPSFFDAAGVAGIVAASTGKSDLRKI